MLYGCVSIFRVIKNKKINERDSKYGPAKEILFLL